MTVEYLEYETDYLFNLEVVKKVNEVIDNLEGGSRGFIDYNDASTQITPVTLPADTWVAIPNDGQGSFSNNSFPPNGVTELLDVNTGQLDLSELPLGSTVLIRNDYSITPSVNNAILRFRYSLGSGLGEYTLEKTVGRLDNGSGIPYRFSLTTDLIYLGDDNTRLNPITLEVNLADEGTLTNAGTVIQVI